MLTDKKIREIRSNVGPGQSQPVPGSARPKLVSQTRAGPGLSAHPEWRHGITRLLGTITPPQPTTQSLVTRMVVMVVMVVVMVRLGWFT